MLSWFFPAEGDGSVPQHIELFERKVVEHDLDIGKPAVLEVLNSHHDNRPAQRIPHDLESK